MDIVYKKGTLFQRGGLGEKACLAVNWAGTTSVYIHGYFEAARIVINSERSPDSTFYARSSCSDMQSN